VLDARAVAGLLEIRTDAAFQVACLADIQDLALGVDVAVDPGQVRQVR